MDTYRNEELRTAWDFVENTGTSIFLTGKAGTGKTTFLRTLRERLPKRMVVVAPTGVAAINAGGVTIHSFFQLPLSPYVPETSYKSRFDFSAEKRSIIRTIDLLVIDEISMVRSDLLDAIDNVLRRFRNSRKPFGGVQLLMIGDLQQLAPVVTEQDAQLLRGHYDTPFFFGSKALAQTPYVTIELHHVYRQSDEHFLQILNDIRIGRPTQQDLMELNARCHPDFRPRQDEGFIRLTTHNQMAQRYNEGELQRLPGHGYEFEAKVEGVFPEYAYPTDTRLVLKEGAQVMFIKNDASPAHLFYNGKIGHVVSIGPEGISVKCPGEEHVIRVEPMEWENTKYVLNEKNKEIEAQVQGTFTQYPLRLAWAITIHKSQGLTFDRAIIDAALSFASGQLYVALSRCKTLEGLVLASPVTERAVICDPRIAAYSSQQEAAARQSIEALPLLREQYFTNLLCELFDFSSLRAKEEWLCRILDEHLYRQFPSLCRQHRAVLQALSRDVMGVAAKWNAVICATPAEGQHAEAFLERVRRSAEYFNTQLVEMMQELMDQSAIDIDNKAVAKRYEEALADLRLEYLVRSRLLFAMSQQDFSSAVYLKAKNRATLDAIDELNPNKQRAGQRKKKDGQLTDDIQHPDLYRQLLQWRNAQAAAQGIQPATILQQRALVNLVNYLPADMPSLVAIPFIGKQTAKRYGPDILPIIGQYAAKNGLQTMRPESIKQASEAKPGVSETKKETLDMYRSGKSPEQIAEERGYRLGTIYRHLAHYVGRGELPLSDFMTADQQHSIEQAFQNPRAEMGLSVVKSLCPPDITYDQIHLVKAYLEGQA